MLLKFCIFVCLWMAASLVALSLSAAQSPTGAPESPKPAADSRAAQSPKSAPSATTSEAASSGQPSPPRAKPDKTLIPGAWGLLETADMSDKARNRSDGVSALAGMLHNRTAIRMIMAALDDKDETIRLLAATSLGDMKARQAIPRLRA